MEVLDRSPVEVNINVETLALTQDAFYTVGFITENESAPRTVIVNSLDDVLSNGYERGSMAYNFVFGVLLQGNMNSVVLRAKRANESYIDAYLADSNNDYYYLVLGTKDLNTILGFNDFLSSSRDIKLQFFSGSTTVSLQGRKLVYYYQPSFTDFDYLLLDSDTVVTLDSGAYIYTDATGINTGYDSSVTQEYLIKQIDGSDLTQEQAQKRSLRFPEGAWIGLCGYYFPSTVQWLYKNIKKSDVFDISEIPEYSTTTSTETLTRDKATLGSGTTCQGFPIHEVVSLDWVKYALQKRVWQLLYQTEKVSATQAGLSLVENAVRYVLDIAVQQGIFSEYQITARSVSGLQSRASISFEATLTQTILEVKKVEGTIYH